MWFGRGVSELGNAVIEVTLPVWVGNLTGSLSQVAAVVGVQMLPAVLVGPLGGVLADRWDARRTMVISDVLRALLFLSLLLVPPSLVIPYIYIVGFCGALVNSIFDPTQNVAVRSVIGSGDIPKAQALSRTAESFTLVVGPVLGSGVLLLFGPAAGALINALSFCMHALAVFMVRMPVREPVAGTSQATGLVADVPAQLRAGIRITLRDTDLVTLLMVYAVLYLVGTVWFAVDVFFVQRSLGAPKESVGLLWTTHGAGSLIGGWILASLAGRLPQRRVLAVGLGWRGASMLWYAMTTSYEWALAAAFSAGVGDILISVALGSMIIARAPKGALGLVSALVETAGQLSGVAALLAVGLLQALLTPAQMLLISGLALSLIGIVAARRLEHSAGG